MTDLQLHVENVGGIDSHTFRTEAGVTLVTGPNATNKTSLLRAVLFGVGADDVTIRTDADRARVELEIDGTRVEREAVRTGHGRSTDGEPLVTDDRDQLLLERFAGLTGTNALRTAVDRGDDVGNLLTEPLDIEALERERSEKLDRKRTLSRTVDSLSGVEADLEDARAEREAAIERRDDLESRVEELAAERAETDDELDELRAERADTIAERDRLQARIQELEASVDRLDERVAARADELEELRAEAAETELDDLERERERLERELDAIDDRLEVLQSVLSTNREMLDSDRRNALGFEATLEGDQVTCWTCGADTQVTDIEDTTDEVAALVEAEKERRREYAPELESVAEAIDAAEDRLGRVDTAETDLEEAKRTREERRSSLARQRERLADVRMDLDDLDSAIESRSESPDGDAGDELESARVERETVRHEIERLEAQVADLEADRERLQTAEAEIDDLSAAITSLTERIESRERELREAFNEAMDDLLEALAFERIERIWLDGEFDLVISRTVDGAVRRDRLDHLAESEREMIGLVLGLAGYLAYDVADISPVITLDSLGAFDADRTARLVEYFAHRTPFLLVAVHPEQATELPHDQRSLEADRVTG